MPKTRSQDKNTKGENAKIAQAALRIAATEGWQGVTLDKIAKAAKGAKKKYKSIYDIVPLIAEEIDREAFAGLGKSAGMPHDILFDLLMARFDILQKNRQAISSMASEARRDKKLSCALGRATIDGAYRMIETSKIKLPPRPALAVGLIAIYGWAFVVWQRDTSRDMSKTMAAVDRGLRLASKATGLLNKAFDAR